MTHLFWSRDTLPLKAGPVKILCDIKLVRGAKRVGDHCSKNTCIMLTAICPAILKSTLNSHLDHIFILILQRVGYIIIPTKSHHQYLTVTLLRDVR